MTSSFGRIYLGSTLVAGGQSSTTTTGWVRPAAWPAIPTVLASEQKIVGLHAVWPGDGVGNGGNFFAFNGQGAYTIDFGDGTVTNFASNTQANYEFNFNNAALADTNRPVTFTASTSTVNRTAHGLSAGAEVQFYNIVTTTGINESQSYYVINPTANSFQVAATPGGSAVTLTNNGSATLLPYKVAIVTITPQAGVDLTSINFQAKHTQTALQAYTTGWLDLAISVPNLSGGGNFTLGDGAILHALVERVNLIAYGALTNMSYMFLNCSSLQSIPAFPGSVSAVTNMVGMFQGCSSLQSIPAFPGSVSAVTNMSNMFLNCSSLQSIPAFPGSVSAVTGMSYMFSGCSSLQSIPPFPGSVSAVTNMSHMFSGCSSLQSIPPFPGSVSAVTNMSYMFLNCSSLQSIPAFPGNVSAVTSMFGMFQGCSSLQSIPAFPGSVSAVTNMINMFLNCTSLQSIPELNMSGIISSANAASMFALNASCSRIPVTGMRFSFSVANCKLSAVALNEIFTGLPTVTGQTITVTGNYGINQAGYDPTIATAKGWTVTA